MDLQTLRLHGQSHLADHLATLSGQSGRAFLEQLESVDWSRCAAMHGSAGPQVAPSLPPDLAAARADNLDKTRREELRRTGLAAVSRGEAAFVLMAGGQGSRLGFDGPKGICPLGLPDDLVLFEIVSRRLARLAELAGAPARFAVMTSPENDQPTREWFAARRNPSQGAAAPLFFQQSLAPALDADGRALLAAPGRLALVPDGNGGIWECLGRSGILAEWKRSGIRWIHVASVDNALSLPCDPVFIGHAVEGNLQLSNKSVVRRDASEKVGVYAVSDGRTRVAEYTELPPADAAATDSDGLPLHREANIASHLVALETWEEFARMDLPWHLARKKISHVDPTTGADLSSDMACKYERFLFDAFPAASRSGLLRVERDREFAPIKNADGADSPATARHALESLHRRWHGDWGSPDPTGWIDPSLSFDGERPANGSGRASF